MMTEEPVRASIQQNLPSTEKTLDLNDKKFKGPRRTLRRKRFTRENEFIDFNQPKMMNDDRVFYRSAQEKSTPPLPIQFQFQIPHQQQSFQQLQLQQFHYQSQQLQSQPQSPQITPPLSTSHPLSSYRTPSSSNPPTNGNQFMMGPQQFPFPMPMPMPMPMHMPMSLPMTMPLPMNYNGTQLPIQMPLQIPLHMAMSMPQVPMQLPNFPLPVFIRLPLPSTSEYTNYFNENLKQLCEVNGSSETSDQMADAGPTCMPSYVPHMFPTQLGPILFGLPQSMMYSRPDFESPFHVAQPLAK